MKYLRYKGYTGSIEYNSEDELLFGKVLGIAGLISYEGDTGVHLEANFKEAVDDYLVFCLEKGKAPERPYKGSFNVRIPAELHQQAALLAQECKTSLNNFVTEAIRQKVIKELT